MGYLSCNSFEARRSEFRNSEQIFLCLAHLFGTVFAEAAESAYPERLREFHYLYTEPVSLINVV